MFLNHWAYEYIVPIYNTDNLEAVLTAAGVPFGKTSPKDKKKEYVKIFPADNGNVKETIQLKGFADNLRKINKPNSLVKTNMHEFIDYCLKLEAKNKAKRQSK